MRWFAKLHTRDQYVSELWNATWGKPPLKARDWSSEREKLSYEDGDMLFDVKSSNNRDTSNIGAYYRFTTTTLDLTKDTLKEAIENKQYVKNECFINSLYDFYGDSLLKTKSQRYMINRAKIFKIIGKTEDDIKEGLSINDVLPFFQKYRLQLKVFDRTYKLIFKYAPELENHNNKTMYCLMADGHIYTMDHSTSKHLEHKQEDEDDKEERDELCPKVSADYYINDEAKASYCHMISNIDDIMTILNKYQVADGDATHIVHVVHETNDFIKFSNQKRGHRI